MDCIEIQSVICRTALYGLTTTSVETELIQRQKTIYPVSTYAFCANNPVKYIDSDGRDVWEINQFGEIINRIKDKIQDAFFIVQQVGGNRQCIERQSVKFDYGIIKDVRKPQDSTRDRDGKRP